jgi:hypothetical protein
MEMKKELNIYRIDITINSDFRGVGEFYFQIDKKISKDKALEITTEAIEHYIDYLLEKDSLIERDDFFSLIERGYIKVGKIYDYNTIVVATLDENVHKVRSLEDAIKEEQYWNIVPEELDVYAIDGTPSKGYVFCKTEKFSDDSIQYDFIFWDKFTKVITHKIYVYIVNWNHDTQRKRYFDTIATPENMFKKTYFRPLNEDIEEEYNISYQKDTNKTTVKTFSYDALYDGFRFDMNINFHPFFHLPNEKKDEIREFHKSFADKINQVLIDDLKYEFIRGYDFADLKYVPLEKIDDIWNIVKEWAIEADKLGGSLKVVKNEKSSI